jgi:hypothetical protein
MVLDIEHQICEEGASPTGRMNLQKARHALDMFGQHDSPMPSLSTPLGNVSYSSLINSLHPFVRH